eukprot:scaffold202_cov58-Phaeocystis_antarctica.AAC.4
MGASNLLVKGLELWLAQLLAHLRHTKELEQLRVVRLDERLERHDSFLPCGSEATGTWSKLDSVLKAADKRWTGVS